VRGLGPKLMRNTVERRYERVNIEPLIDRAWKRALWRVFFRTADSRWLRSLVKR
jgi:hypothetical protein